jgi:hypothetical protein
VNHIGPGSPLAIAYAGGAIAMWGAFYDTAWHRTLGRDTFWSLPHLFIYGGGVLVWVAVSIAFVLTSRGQLAGVGGPIVRVGPLRLPFGFALAALGVVTVIGAAPVDIWYHGAFGKDATIWSPPHMQGVVGAMVAATGVMFAVAAQRGRGPFARPWLWTLAILLDGVYLIHMAHYALAHYTMTPWTRTPDFYPLLAAIMFPAVLVALAQLAGPLAPVLASLLFLGASVTVDVALQAIAFERYTITPVIAVPALAVAAVTAVAPRAAGRAWLAAVAGVAFILTFIAIEAAWMAWVVDRPWPRAAVVEGLPAALLVAALSGLVGWVWGAFMRAPTVAGGAAEMFGSRPRARAAAVGALALVAVAVMAVYRPQVYGPPMTVAELALEPSARVMVQEAVFWEAVLDDDFGQAPSLEIYSEGIIDGILLPIGPAWCSSDGEQLARELPHVRFALEVNGAPVDLNPYPIVRVRLRDGRECGWVGMISRRQRASRNHFVYAITPLAGAPAAVRPMRVDLTAVFKDP